MTDFRRRFLAALTHSGPGYDTRWLPRRGDQVDQWLTERRDRFEQCDAEWDVIDDLLRQYRCHADLDTPLIDRPSKRSTS
jgi:hypothetical protein